jgi:DNA polymerase
VILTHDFETQSEADLMKVGAWAYSEHPSTRVICASWALDDSLIGSWANPDVAPNFECPSQKGLGRLMELAEDSDVLFEAHNAAFEYAVWHNVMVPRHGGPPIPVERYRDSMAVACYYALPAALDNLCKVLGLPGKDPAGARLITKYSKLHLKTAQRDIPPEDVEAFVGYCEQDVDQEREVGRVLGSLPEEEERVFVHDFRVNARGLGLDAGGIVTAREVVDSRAEELAADFREITDLNPGQTVKVLAWFRENGLPDLENLQKDTLGDLLDEDDLPSREVRDALLIRREHSRASTRKLDAMARQRGRDGRARFQTRYHGAVTGRNTGTGFQPLNLSRGFDKMDPEQLVRDIMRGDARWLNCLYGDTMTAIGKASRYWIVPDEGHRIVAGDFVSIEAIILAVLAGEEWKVEAFRDEVLIYERMAEKIHGLPVGSVSKETYPMERQDGKIGELAFGYQGALGAWRNFDHSDRHEDGDILGFVRAWRSEHPATTDFWRCLGDAALAATQRPGSCYGYRDVGFERVDGWLTMILPNDKRLWYWAPETRMMMPPWHKPRELEECAAGECGHEPRPTLTYQCQKEGRWRRVHTYGGKLTENAVQATSRELLKPAELRADRYGYPVILSVYDEVVCEVPDGRGSDEEFQEIMEELPRWAENWPVRAEVWNGRRYRK